MSKKWDISVCRGCKAKACGPVCQHFQARRNYALGRYVKQAQREFCFLSPRDDRELVAEFMASRQVELVPTATVGGLPARVRDLMLERGLTLVALDSDGAEVEEDLIPGIFAQAAEESIEDALWRQGYPNTKLHAVLDFGSGVLDGRVDEDILFDVAQAESVWNEPLPKAKLKIKGREKYLPGWKTYPREHALKEQLEREARFAALTDFLKVMFQCVVKGRGPALVRTERGMRFLYRHDHKKLMDPETWAPLGRVMLEEVSGLRDYLEATKEFDVVALGGKVLPVNRITVRRRQHVAAAVTVGYEVDPAFFMEALWAYVWWRRRQWLQKQCRPADVTVHGPACTLEAKPVWLAETHLSAVREAFRQMCIRLELPKGRWPNIREERRVEYLEDLQDRLKYLEDLESRSIARLHKLQAAKALDEVRLQKALEFLEQLFQDKEQLQGRLEQAVLFQAKELYGEDFLGYDLTQAEHSPEALEELKAELIGYSSEELAAA